VNDLRTSRSLLCRLWCIVGCIGARVLSVVGGRDGLKDLGLLGSARVAAEIPSCRTTAWYAVTLFAIVISCSWPPFRQTADC
jgi:hypothetical protein